MIGMCVPQCMCYKRNHTEGMCHRRSGGHSYPESGLASEWVQAEHLCLLEESHCLAVTCASPQEGPEARSRLLLDASSFVRPHTFQEYEPMLSAHHTLPILGTFLQQRKQQRIRLVAGGLALWLSVLPALVVPSSSPAPVSGGPQPPVTPTSGD